MACVLFSRRALHYPVFGIVLKRSRVSKCKNEYDNSRRRAYVKRKLEVHQSYTSHTLHLQVPFKSAVRERINGRFNYRETTTVPPEC